MSFYSPSDSQFTRHYREEVDLVLSGIDCVLHREHVIYCSSALTTGLRLYEVLHERGLKTASELRQQMGDAWFESNLWNVNLAAAIQFAEDVRHRFDDRTIVITPAPFSARGWNQEEYLAFWETLLRTRIKAAWFNRNWQFSNGCTFEFAVAQDAGLPAFDEAGQPLSKDQGVHLMREAVSRLKQQGFDTAMIEKNLLRTDSMHVHVDDREFEALGR